MYSNAWRRRRRQGFGLTNRHDSAQATAARMSDFKDKDVPAETQHEDWKNSDEAEDGDDEEIEFAI